jgi:hypothetical protein
MKGHVDEDIHKKGEKDASTSSPTGTSFHAVLNRQAY